jgi:hypothetical protein
MNRRQWWIAFGLQWLLIAALAFVVWQRSAGTATPGASPGVAERPTITLNGSRQDDHDDQDGPSARSANAANGKAPATSAGLVRLEAAVQQASDVRTAIAVAMDAPASSEAWGQVLATQGLAEAHLRLRQSALEVEQWTPQIVRAIQEADRQEALFREGGNVALKSVEQAHADRTVLEQRQRAARSLQAATQAAVRAEWGEQIGHALDAVDGGDLADVLAGRQRLLLVADGSHARASVTVPESELAVPVQRLAPAMQVEAGGGRPSWYWLAPAAPLRAGQRVRMAVALPVQRGVRLPEPAVVWQAGLPWVYVQTDGEHFRRQSVTLSGALADGWFAEAGVAAGARIVVRGAQLLLSEESRALIRNENGD